MAQYTVLKKSFINNMIAEEGEIIEYDGEPSANLELIPGQVIEPVIESVIEPVRTK